MKKNTASTVIYILFMVAISFASLKVMATINPYYLVLKEIAGDRAEVSLLIGPGQNPHIYSPTISDVRRMNEADLIIANGLDLESFMSSAFKDLENRGKTILFAGTLLPATMLGEDDHDNHENHDEHPAGDTDDDHHHSINPHVWLDPLFLSDYIIPGIVETLKEMDPVNGYYYSDRAADLSYRLRLFYAEAGRYLDQFRGSVVIVAHPSFSYFFDRFGITLEPVLQGIGDEPSIQDMKRLVDFVKSENVIGIFAEYQQSKRPIDILIKETSVRNGNLDGLGISRVDAVEHFEWNLEEMKRVFGRE